MLEPLEKTDGVRASQRESFEVDGKPSRTNQNTRREKHGII
ncbi:hypothetical protein [Tuanshanicoccus yangjingiae]